jgi:ketosteroid isomerase-like protein
MITRDEMQALLDRMASAYSAGDAKTCAAMFSENAQIHSTFGAPALGRQAIEALHVQWTAEPGKKSFTILDWGSDQSLAWCLCRFSEGDVTGDGTSLLVLERGPAGDWFVRSCCLHGDPEPE